MTHERLAAVGAFVVGQSITEVRWPGESQAEIIFGSGARLLLLGFSAQGESRLYVELYAPDGTELYPE